MYAQAISYTTFLKQVMKYHKISNFFKKILLYTFFLIFSVFFFLQIVRLLFYLNEIC